MILKVEKFWSVGDVKRDLFPSRSARWIKDTFRSGAYGPVLRDDAGWQISESALVAYQARHAVGVSPAPVAPAVLAKRLGNLKQFKSSRV